MRNKELAAAVAVLRKLLTVPGLENAYREELRKGLRELETVARSGKPDLRRVYRAVDLIARSWLYGFQKQDAPVTPDGSDVER